MIEKILIDNNMMYYKYDNKESSNLSISLQEFYMSDLKAIEYKRFEDIKHINENGSEYWSARELAVALDYVQWRNFEKSNKTCNDCM